MKRLIVLLTLICGSIGTAESQATAQESLTGKVDRLFAKWDKPDSPGCVLGVIRNGQFVYKRGYGAANLDYGIPIDADTVFYIASMSKQFTAMSIALLAEQGKLSLDDDIRKYLPEMPRYERPVTIRNLIYHTSGIRDFIVLRYLAAVPTSSASSDDENYERMARTSNEENFKLITRQKALNFAPGDEHMYSNSNYTLLAEIVRRASGKPLSQFADENIFRPLEMNNTHYYDDLLVVIKNLAVGYSPASSGYVPVSTNNGSVGPAGVLTTVDDLLLWDRNFYDNKLGKGGQRLIDVALTPGVLNNGDRLQYAFGLVHYKYQGLEAIGHDGGFFGFKTTMNRYPQEHFTVINLCNAKNIPMDALADQVADIYLADQFRPATPAAAVKTDTQINMAVDELPRFVGIYRNPITEGQWMLSVKDGKLVDPGSGGSVLVPIGENRFRVSGQPVELLFEMPPNGRRPVRMLKSIRGGRPQVYEAVEAVTLSGRQLADYAGSYHSDEIDATYDLIVRDESLWLKRIGGRDIRFQPTFKDHFWNDEFGYIGFVRNRKKNVTALSLTSGWIRHLRFDKVR